MKINLGIAPAFHVESRKPFSADEGEPSRRGGLANLNPLPFKVVSEKKRARLEATRAELMEMAAGLHQINDAAHLAAGTTPMTRILDTYHDPRIHGALDRVTAQEAVERGWGAEGEPDNPVFRRLRAYPGPSTPATTGQGIREVAPDDRSSVP